MNILFMFKSKLIVKIVSHDNYSKRNFKQGANSHKIVLLAKFCRQCKPSCLTDPIEG